MKRDEITILVFPATENTTTITMHTVSPIFRTALLTVVLLGILASSCKKDDDSPSVPTGGNGTPAPSSNQLDGILQAFKMYGSPTENRATATFLSGDSIVSVNHVSLNGVDLIESQFFPWYNSPVPSPLDFSSNATIWDVDGANGVPSFHRDLSYIPFSDVSPITSSLTIDLSEGYTMVTNGFPGADSVLFQVGVLAKILPANATICGFTAAELLNYNSPGITKIQASGMNYYEEAIGGKRLLFIKRAGWQESATLVQ